MADDTEEVDVWTVVRPTWLRHTLWNAGARIAGIGRRHPDLAPANEAARRLQGSTPVPGADKMAAFNAREHARITELVERPPYAGLRVIRRSPNGNPIWGTQYAHERNADEAPQPEPASTPAKSDIHEVPHLRWRDPRLPSAHIDARAKKHAGQKQPHEGVDTEVQP